MSLRILAAGLALCGASVLDASTALAQPSPAMRQAILADLNAATRAEVQRRATAGNSVEEVLAVILLNNLQLADAPNARVIAIDYVREVAVIQVGEQAYRVVPFDRRTLTAKR